MIVDQVLLDRLLDDFIHHILSKIFRKDSKTVLRVINFPAQQASIRFICVTANHEMTVENMR